VTVAVLASPQHIRRTTMEVNQLKRHLKDLGERIGGLRGFL
jgi:hypothetical protein